MYSFMRFTNICLLGVAVSAGPALAWFQAPATPPEPPPRIESAAKPKTKAPAREATIAGDKPRAKLRPMTKADRAAKARSKRRAASKKRKSKPKFQMNPDAKWSCDQQLVTLEPVWRSGKTLTFPFLIRNEGTADLRISAKGG